MMANLFESELELEDELEGELEDETELELEDEAGLEGEGWLSAIGNIAGSLLGETEEEDEGEGELEGFAGEEEISPIRKIYPDAMMEHLGELAAEAESEEEAAEQFLPLIGMAASKLLPVVARAVLPAARRALPQIARTLTRATPQLTRGVGRFARTLFRNPRTRHLLRTVPGIARRTVGQIARQVAHGRRVTPQTALRTFGQQARRILGNRRLRTHALRRHNHLERRMHTRYFRGMTRTHARPQYGYRWGAPGGYSGGSGGVVYGRPGGVPARGGYQAGPMYWSGPMASAGTCACGRNRAQASTSPPAPAYCGCCGQQLR